MAAATTIDGLPELEKACATCEGKRGYAYENGWHTCPDCHGRGYHPTEFGERVLAMMRRNFTDLMREANPD